ncbi:TPA: fimbrial protein [Enterobacter hormaechei subsp. xiangfangensis]|nr:fimbrial protein [Enterobacter hormaechei subsp. xiangfangensis]
MIKRSGLYLALTVLTGYLLLLPLQVLAGQNCPPTMGDAVINFQNYSITDNPSLPPGAMLSGAILGQENRSFYNCAEDTGPVTMRFVADNGLTVAAVSGSAPNGSGAPASVYDVPDIPGVGFAVGIRETTHCAGQPVHYIPSGDNSVVICSTNDPSQMATQFFVVFYKTAQEIIYEQPNSGQIRAGKLILESANGTVISEAGVTVEIAATDLKVHKSSCYISDNNISVNMGQSNVSDLNNSIEGEKHRFSIPLTCDSSQTRAVKIGFFGPTEKDSPGNDVLTLSQQEGAATGVGIRILYGDSFGASQGLPVPLNSTSVEAYANTANQTLFTLSYDAQYVRTSSSVTAGQADALATFSLIYN